MKWWSRNRSRRPAHRISIGDRVEVHGARGNVQSVSLSEGPDGSRIVIEAVSR